jgi:hypothetical protein
MRSMQQLLSNLQNFLSGEQQHLLYCERDFFSRIYFLLSNRSLLHRCFNFFNSLFSWLEKWLMLMLICYEKKTLLFRWNGTVDKLTRTVQSLFVEQVFRFLSSDSECFGPVVQVGTVAAGTQLKFRVRTGWGTHTTRKPMKLHQPQMR